VIFDNTIKLEEFIPELNKHLKEYRDSIPKLTKLQKFAFYLRGYWEQFEELLTKDWDCFD
jgi:hypothetical protein